MLAVRVDPSAATPAGVVVVLLDLLQQEDLAQAICAVCTLKAVGRLRRTCRAALQMRMHPEFDWAWQARPPSRPVQGRCARWALIELVARAQRKPQAALWLSVAEPEPYLEAMMSVDLHVQLRVHALARLHELARPRVPGVALHLWGDPLAFAAQPQVRECAVAAGLPEPADMAVLVVVLLGSRLASSCLVSRHPAVVRAAAGRLWQAPHPAARLSVLAALTILRWRRGRQAEEGAAEEGAAEEAAWAAEAAAQAAEAAAQAAQAAQPAEGGGGGPPALAELVDGALRLASLWHDPWGARATAGRALEAFAPDLPWGEQRLSERVLMAAAFGGRRGEPDVSPLLRALQHALRHPGARRLLSTRSAMAALGRLATAAGPAGGAAAGLAAQDVHPVQQNDAAADLLVRLAGSAGAGAARDVAFDRVHAWVRARMAECPPAAVRAVAAMASACADHRPELLASAAVQIAAVRALRAGRPGLLVGLALLGRLPDALQPDAALQREAAATLQSLQALRGLVLVGGAPGLRATAAAMLLNRMTPPPWG